MVECKDVLLDSKYQIMSEIAENENISQRELSKKLGISLGSVNVLINKMIKEGLIKIEQVSQKQVLYMLTPVGIMEKTKKTVSYLKAHYRAIYETKERIKTLLSNMQQIYDEIFILSFKDEMGEIIKVALDEYNSDDKNNIKLIYDKEEINIYKDKKIVLLHMLTDDSEIKSYFDNKDVEIYNILEKIGLDCFR